MGNARRFVANSFWLAVSTAGVLIVGAAYRPVIARVLQEAGYGRYVFIQTFVTYFLGVGFFGLRAVVAREIGRDERSARACLVSALKIRAITVPVAILACCSVGYLLKKGSDVTVGIYILSLSMIAVGLGDLFESALIGFGRSFHIAVSNLVGAVLKLVVGLWALRSGYGLFGVLWVYVCASAVVTAMQWRFVSSVTRRQSQKDIESGQTKYLFRQGVPFFAMYLSQRLYQKNDILLLTLLVRDDAVTGVYGAAYVFFDLLMSVGNCIGQTAFPIVARLHGKSVDGITEGYDLSAAYERLHKHILLLFLPAAVLSAWFSREMLLAVFGKEFLAGVAPMRILAWWPVLEMSSLVSSNFLSGTYRHKLAAGISIAMSILGVVWTLWFVLLYGAVGAAWATIGSGVVNAVVRYAYVRRHVGGIRWQNIWLKPVVCSAAMYLGIYVVADKSWVVRLPAALISYGLALLIVRPYDSEDKKLFLSVTRRQEPITPQDTTEKAAQ